MLSVRVRESGGACQGRHFTSTRGTRPTVSNFGSDSRLQKSRGRRVKRSKTYTSSTVDTNDLSIDPLTVLGGQEGGDSGDVDGHADAVHGGPGGGVLVDLLVVEVLAVGDVLLAHGVVHVGLDAAGGDGVDGDLLVAAVDGHAAHEGLDGALGARVDGVLGDTLGLARDAAHEDDAAAGLEVLVGLAGHEELASGVDVEDAVKLLLGHVLEVAEGHHARVGHDDVELAKVLLGLGEHVDNLRHVRDVGLDGDRVAAHGLDLGDELVGRLGAVGVVDHHVGTTAGELESGLTAHASS